MVLSFQNLSLSSLFIGKANICRNTTKYRTQFSPSKAIKVHFLSVSTEENRNLAEYKRITGSVTALTRCKVPDSWMNQENTVGIIGGLSASSTLIFLEKLVWGSSRNKKESVPFIVCSDSTIKSELSTYSALISTKDAQMELHRGEIVENLRRKRTFLEQSGARCIVMPCHVSHVWHREVSEGCSVPFLSVGDCVSGELKGANLKPLEAGSKVRIGVLAGDANLVGNFYQEKLQSQVRSQLLQKFLFF